MKNTINLFLFIFCFNFFSFAQNQQAKSFEVYFDVDQHTLRSESVKTLDEIHVLANQFKILEVVLTAHTDNDASDDYNQKLSERRAQTVSSFLQLNEMKESKISIQSLGESRPVAQNLNEQGKQLNRRVEVLVRFKTFQTVDEVLEEIRPDPQKFKLMSNEKAVLIGKDGCIIAIPSNAFQTKSGRKVSNENIQIELTEALGQKAALLNNLTTISNGEILESGGMMKIEAKLGSESLEIRPNSELNVEIPSENLQDGMTVFNGRKDESGSIVWDNTKESFNAQESALEEHQVVLDTNMLLRLKVDIKPYKKATIDQFTMTLPSVPVRPDVPSPPRKPKKLDPDKMAHGFFSFMVSKKTKQRRANEHYEGMMVSYEKRMDRYRKNIKSHQHKLDEYAQQMEAYKDFTAGYHKTLDHHIKDIKTHLEYGQLAYNQVRLNRAIDKVVVQIRNADFKTIMPRNYLKRSANEESQHPESSYFNNMVRLYNAYNSLKHYDMDYVRKNFCTDNEVRLMRIINKGAMRRNYRAGNFQFNSFADSVFNAENVSKMTKEAVELKQQNDKRDGIVTNYSGTKVYTAALNKIGWINCDRFRRKKDDLTMVSVLAAAGVKVVAFIKRFNSVLNVNGNKVRLPKNNKVKMVFIKMEDSRAYLAIQEFKPSESPIVEPRYESVSLDELSNRIDQL